MLDCLTASRSAESWRCDPMTTDQIDAHPDSARIWATIAALRDAAERHIETETRRIEEDATQADFEDANDEIERRNKSLREAMEDNGFACPEWLEAAISKLCAPL